MGLPVCAGNQLERTVPHLAADKPAVFREIARVLKPGGRIGSTDIIADDSLTPEQRAERGSYVGCIAGALSFSEFEAGLHGVGLIDVSVTPTHSVADGMFSAIVKASKGVEASSAAQSPGNAPVRELAVTAAGCCGGEGCC